MHGLPLWLLPLAPAFGALLAGLLALTRRAEKTAPFLVLIGTALSAVNALGASPNADMAAGHFTATWLTVTGGFQIALGVHLDPLAWTMVLWAVSVVAHAVSLSGALSPLIAGALPALVSLALAAAAFRK